MSTFSEESRLLIGNWEAVTDILQAHRRLQSELVGIIRALEPQLAATDWWSHGWAMTYQDQGAVLANSRWRRGGTDPVMIWLYLFTPDAVFGEASPPVLCLYVVGKRGHCSATCWIKCVSGAMAAAWWVNWMNGRTTTTWHGRWFRGASPSSWMTTPARSATRFSPSSRTTADSSTS